MSSPVQTINGQWCPNLGFYFCIGTGTVDFDTAALGFRAKIAKTLDLLTNFSFRVEVLLKGFGDGIVTKISVLNRSWVAVSIFHFPFSLLGFEILVSHIVQLNLV